MDIIKRLFTFNDNDDCAIGLCKFNDSFYKELDNKEQIKKRLNKNVNLSQMLKKPV